MCKWKDFPFGTIEVKREREREGEDKKGASKRIQESILGNTSTGTG